MHHDAQNFGCTIVESQTDSSEPSSSRSVSGSSFTDETMERLNLAFTIFFTVEFAISAFAYWFRPFLSGWSLFDAFIVSMSLLSVFATSTSSGVTRILRALRVVRLFGKVRSLRKIISALSKAILPVLNVFLILFLLLSIGEHTISIFKQSPILPQLPGI